MIIYAGVAAGRAAPIPAYLITFTFCGAEKEAGGGQAVADVAAVKALGPGT